MDSKKIKSGLAAAATLSLLVACGPAPNTNPSPSPSAGESAAPSAAPSADVSASPSASPSSEASPSASPSASSNPDSSPNPGTSAEPSAQPTATATSDISVVEKTTFNGKVYDDEGSPLNEVTIKVKSLNSAQSYEATTTTAGGTYAFNNAPSGVQLEITASKSGYTTRRRVEVLKSNKDGDPNANRYDFGTEDGIEGDSGDFGIGYNGLSDKPEVVAVTPGRNASGVDPATSFVVKFSEGMDTETVEDNFAIYTATTETLSVDDGSLTNGYDVDADEEVTFVGVEGTDATDDDAEEALGNDFHTVSISEQGATLIYDNSDFDVSWNSDDTEVTFTFADESHLPTDTESANVPDYLVSFTGVDDGQLKDKSGVTRDEGDGGYFKLTDGDFEMWYDFSIDTDEEEPQVLSVEATDDSGTSGDEVSVEFSEPMMLNTRAGQILGVDEESPLNPANYALTVTRGDTTIAENVSLNAYQGSLRFDSDDDTNSTVLLRSSFQGWMVSDEVPNGSEEMTAILYHEDGSTTEITANATQFGEPGAAYSDIADDIDDIFFDDNDVVTMTELVDNNARPGSMDPGDTFTIEIEEGALTAGNNSPVTYGIITGELAEMLGLDGQVIPVGQSLDAGDSVNMFQAGDQVSVTVSRAVVDPAGNSVDSSNDEEDDTAN